MAKHRTMTLISYELQHNKTNIVVLCHAKTQTKL